MERPSWIAALGPIWRWSVVPWLGEGKQKSFRLVLEEPEHHLPLGETWQPWRTWKTGTRSHKHPGFLAVFPASHFFLTSINVLFRITCWSKPYLLCSSSIAILPSLCIFASVVYVFCSSMSGLMCFLVITAWLMLKAEDSQKMSRLRISETMGGKVSIWRRVRMEGKQMLYRGIMTAGWSNSKFQAERIIIVWNVRLMLSYCYQ